MWGALGSESATRGYKAKHKKNLSGKGNEDRDSSSLKKCPR